VTFEPSAERGASLDRRMRERLADSFDYLFGEIGEPLGVDRKAAAQLSARVRAAPQSPHVFGAYYDLVLTVECDALDEARQLARELIGIAPAPTLRIAAIDDRGEAEAERYRRLFLSDPDLAAQPDATLLADARGRIDAAFALLDRGFAAMSAEIRELLREIVIAAGPEDQNALTFDGASSYMLWGATLLNARGQKTVLDTAQALAHESGHNLLFGFCASEPLVENADEELFSSPLRIDPRPMDGIVHATYVIARMHQTLERLFEAGVLAATETELAITDMAAHHRNFEAGDQVIRDGGRLTPLGRAVIESARGYMRSAVSPAPSRPAVSA
jgi:HEXXH motif-containing protein